MAGDTGQGGTGHRQRARGSSIVSQPSNRHVPPSIFPPGALARLKQLWHRGVWKQDIRETLQAEFNVTFTDGQINNAVKSYGYTRSPTALKAMGIPDIDDAGPEPKVASRVDLVVKPDRPCKVPDGGYVIGQQPLEFYRNIHRPRS